MFMHQFTEVQSSMHGVPAVHTNWGVHPAGRFPLGMMDVVATHFAGLYEFPLVESIWQ